ncbi:MAG: hypothetical protein JNL19_16655 [Burkholderiales bacterium]|nr:hypothetical protein [Burkholderiales bacterium]
MLSAAATCQSPRTAAAGTSDRARASLAALVCGIALIGGFAPASYAIPGQPGTLDASWATLSPLGAGKLITPIGTGDDAITAVALQPNGKVVGAGYCWNGNNMDFCLARYNANGTLDTGFNGNGKVITTIGAGHDFAFALALQPDGKAIVAGECAVASSSNFCLARFTAGGVLDTSFGSAGIVITPMGANGEQATSLAVQTDGKIVVAGGCSNGSSFAYCVARYNANGALDASFNGTGKVITAMGSGGSASALAVQPDGKIVVAGSCSNGGNSDFCLARYTASGALDPTFGSNGKVITAIGASNDTASALALQPDGKIVVAGTCVVASTETHFCVARYGDAGALDTTFGGGGTVITTFGLIDTASALALQADGKIVVAGDCPGVNNADYCLARYNANGDLDASFGSGGKVTTAIGSDVDRASALAVQPDGKIVVAGYCRNGSNYDFCVARYEGGPFDAQNCKLDLDGDGVVLATTDALILARVSLGLTGNAVIGGIAFASHASRQTWADIRTYLVTQCGLSIAP